MSLVKNFVVKYPAFGSSQDPEKLSLTVQAAALAVLPALTLVLGIFGVDAGWLKELVNALVGLSGSALMVYGILRKFKKTPQA